jgi:16S rRNA processing protein RimM
MPAAHPPHPNDHSEAGVSPASEPVFLVLGQIMRPHGVRGELRLRVITDYPERIGQLDTVYIGPDPHDAQSAVAFAVAATRRHREHLLVKLKGLDTRDEVEPYRGQWLMVRLADAVPLAEGEYYVYQVLNADVITIGGDHIGKVREVLETGANDVFVVQGDRGEEILIPDVPHVVVDIDIANKQITVDPLPGLLPE